MIYQHSPSTEACGDEPLEEATAGTRVGLGVGSTPWSEVVHDSGWGSAGPIGIRATSGSITGEIRIVRHGRNNGVQIWSGTSSSLRGSATRQVTNH